LAPRWVQSLLAPEIETSRRKAEGVGGDPPLGLLILRHDRRRILWLGVTPHPTSEWIGRQLVEALGWEQAPRYVLRDRDRAYGRAFTRRIRTMGIRDRPTAPRSPWQNAYGRLLVVISEDGQKTAPVPKPKWQQSSEDAAEHDVCYWIVLGVAIIPT
jgi:hypothetical protein